MISPNKNFEKYIYRKLSFLYRLILFFSLPEIIDNETKR